MFGIFRLLLALGVVAHHTLIFALVGHVGHYAVFCFFALSGFLMTKVLQERYGYDAGGLRRYLVNRALRIYPPYWVALALGLAVLALGLPPAGSFRLPATADQWLRNVALFGLHAGVPARPVSPAWSLHVELCFYVLMGLGLSRWRWSTALWWAASAAWVVLSFSQGSGEGARFATLQGASIAFASGACCHHFLGERRLPTAVTALACVALAVWFVASRRWVDPAGAGLYVALGLGLVVIRGLAPLRATGWLARVDTGAGQLSYPIFVVHAPLVPLVGAWWGAKIGPGFAFATACASVAAAVLLHRLVERPLERVRDRLRPAARETVG